MNFQDKTALVTGGASGIGKATVMELARCGAKVVCADVNEAAGAALQREAGATNFAVEFVAVDLADPDSIRRCAEQVLARHAGIDILVNAAGWNDIQPFVENPPDYMDRVLAINLGGTLHLTQALLPAMIAAGRGKIVNVSSDAGRVGSTGETAYAAAKGGVIAFTKSLAREVARHSINVNCVCPGPTDTPMLQSRPDKLKDAFLRAIPFRRFARPQ
jgi:2-hydroxycyclohexanecarboxyl-CoA dehydrogenase